nr:semaphorin-1A-like isoform X2 [Leptinotarsa decemlineata]
MPPSAFSCLPQLHLLPLILLYFIKTGQGWLPDTSTKLTNGVNKIVSVSFTGNTSSPDHFTVLYQDEDSILLGGRNQIYNLSVFDFSERKGASIYWPSSEAHGQICNLKGKTEEDCQNYIRILFPTSPGKFLICGTNSYKPLCRILHQKDGKFYIDKEMIGVGLCPFDPEHNSTAIYSNGHLFSATVADFSGTDPLIYKEPLRTELSDLRQLNAPNFVSSLTYGDYIYFFFRETAVEYMNCGKIIYSRVARVCKHDKGGPHQSRDRWTTFLKARLNCSVPGEYPFYFDEIQSTSDIVEGKYGNETKTQIVYATLTTPNNAIGGSALCIFKMEDIQSVFEGPFKHQESINANWLPIPEDKVPTPRPGKCVTDSRVLADKNVNFIKTHPLMEKAVPAFNGKPLMIRVSLHYRFTVVAVDPQVRTVNDETFDVIYIGTDDGKVLKVVNIPSLNHGKAFVISENELFPKGTPVKQLKTVPGYGKVVAVSLNEVKLVTLNHCKTINRCSECIELRDPHCAWDSIKDMCVSVDEVTSFRYLFQDVRRGDTSRCRDQLGNKKISSKDYESNSIDLNTLDEDKKIVDPLLKIDEVSTDCNEVDGQKITGCASQSKLTLYTSEYLHIIVAVACIAGLFVGFLCGYLVSRRFHFHAQNKQQYNGHPNHLDSTKYEKINEAKPDMSDIDFNI